jgi:CubicO group peptidase (beta-lactamase class C family)
MNIRWGTGGNDDVPLHQISFPGDRVHRTMTHSGSYILRWVNDSELDKKSYSTRTIFQIINVLTLGGAVCQNVCSGAEKNGIFEISITNRNRNTMAKILLTLVLTILFTFQVLAQVDSIAKTTKRIETYLTELEKVGFSGAVLVELNGKKVISRGYGYRNQELKENNTPNTIFDIGSLTKQFTASAILKLEMQGKLNTSDPITKYFQGVPSDKSSITIHDLLRHQSGLPSNVGKDYDPVTEGAFMDSVMKAPLRFKPATGFSYSNIGYSLLALILEKVSGQSYEQYLYENLWKPAGMETTGYSRPHFDHDFIAVGYSKSDVAWGKPTSKQWNEHEPYLHLKGNGGILSTIEDLYKWHTALMTDRILSKEAKQKLYHPQIRPNEKESPIYAYGWDVSRTNRNTFRVWHNGTNGIFYADFMRFIDEETALIMMSNKSNRDFDRLNFALAKIIFEKSYTPVVAITTPVIPIEFNATNRKFSQEIIETVLNKGLDEAKLQYERRPSKTDILEVILNTKGYELLSQKKYDEAIAVFTMNIIAYPTSANAFDSLGEAFMTKGDKVSAIKNYEKSLQLDPQNDNAEDMLKQLKQ